MTCPRYQPKQQRDQRPIGPDGLRPGTLAELALQDSELMMEQQNLRSSPGRIATRDPSSREDLGGEEEEGVAPLTGTTPDPPLMRYGRAGSSSRIASAGHSCAATCRRSNASCGGSASITSTIP